MLKHQSDLVHSPREHEDLIKIRPQVFPVMFFIVTQTNKHTKQYTYYNPLRRRKI